MTVTQEPQNASESVTLETVSMTDLYNMTLEPMPQIIPGFLSTGLNILGGVPKAGKGWMCLQIAHAVATGGSFLGVKAKQGRVLYLALEDTLYRLKTRMQRMGLQPTDQLELAIAAPMLRQGGLEAIWAYVHTLDNVQLVIIDTLAKMRDHIVGGGNAYDSDSALGGALQSVALEGKFSLLIVHHMSKAGNKDFLMALSGSAGLPGAADMVLGLERVRNDTIAKLNITGRDTGERQLYPELQRSGWQLPMGAVGYRSEEAE